jgi:protein translocase SecG subunit
MTGPLAVGNGGAYPLPTMTAFLVVLHILVCLFLVLFVLLQPGARGGVGAAFGGAGGQTVFGGRGANTFLAKLTAGAAVVFMITSIRTITTMLVVTNVQKIKVLQNTNINIKRNIK